MISKIVSAIAPHRTALQNLSQAIWDHPEIAWEEKFAVESAKTLLENAGFKVETGCFGTETAFTAEYANPGDGPVFAVASEYDALPEIGHGCGHNLICVAGIAAFLAVASLLKETGVPGKIVLLGTPAEEGAGGKVKMLANGCLKGVDAVMMSHPGKKYFTDSGSTANAGWEVTFHGKAAHAAGSPDKGINALDAVNLLFAAVGAYRQQMPGCALIHGFINNGGVAANIIPDLTKCRFYLRTSEESFMPELERRFRNMVRGAELMTDCTAEIAPFRAAYRSRRPNTPLNEEFASVIEEMGYPVVRPQFAGKGSTDFGDFSQTIPGVHTSFAIVEDGECELPGHSILFREASRSQFGFDQAMNAGAAMAKTAWRFITDEAFRAAVKEDFQKRG
jgi:amidohydrolase